MSREARQGLIALACVLCLSVASGIWIGRSQRPPAPDRHEVYIISAARVDDIGGYKLRFDYSLDGIAQTVFLADKPGEQERFIAYLVNLRK